jgi:hypothetical protein
MSIKNTAVTRGHDKANPQLRWAFIATPLSSLLPRSPQQHRRTKNRAADQ